MSRVLGYGFILCDAVATVASFLSSSGIFLLAVFSVLTSLALAAMPSAVQSILWPTYFWDQPEQIRLVVPKKSLQTRAENLF